MFLTRDQLLAVLEDLMNSIATGDSKQGTFTFDAFTHQPPAGSFEVTAAWSVGAWNGQPDTRAIMPTLVKPSEPNEETQAAMQEAREMATSRKQTAFEVEAGASDAGDTEEEPVVTMSFTDAEGNSGTVEAVETTSETAVAEAIEAWTVEQQRKTEGWIAEEADKQSSIVVEHLGTVDWVDANEEWQRLPKEPQEIRAEDGGSLNDLLGGTPQ